MDSVTKARQTQLANIESKTGCSLDQLRVLIAESGLSKHGEIRQMLVMKFGLGFGDADMLTHFARNTDGQSAAEAAGLSDQDVLDVIYCGSKMELRPLHEQLMLEIKKLGEFNINPKKGYVSLRRKRQFVMLGPGSKGRLEIGLNMKGIEGTERLFPQTNNLMCQYKVFISSADEIDEELLQWINTAYQASA